MASRFIPGGQHRALPLRGFDNQPLYRAGCAPDGSEIGARIEQYFRPYHQALAAEIEACRRGMASFSS